MNEYAANRVTEHDLVKLCIIDDIPAVVRGLSERIDWKAHGIEVVATASEGQQGLERIHEHRPDIVVTDIRMPFMDGLDMMRHVLDERPEVKVIFMSGHTDFNYAQEAVRLGAFDFILKPFTPTQVIESVTRAAEEVRERRSRSVKMRDMEQKLRESLPYLRQEHMRLLIRYGPGQRDPLDQWTFLGIGLKPENFCVMVAEMDFFAEQTASLPAGEVELIRFAIQNVLEETLDGCTQSMVFRDTLSRLVLVLNTREGLDVQQLAERCRENVLAHTRRSISIGVGGEVREPSRLSIAHSQALSALGHTFFTGGNSVYRFSELDLLNSDVPRYSYEKEKELLYCLRSANFDKAAEKLDEIWAEWLSICAHPAPEPIKTLCMELAHSVQRTLAEKLTENECRTLDAEWNAIAHAASFEEMQRRIRAFCLQGCSMLRQRQVGDAQVLVERVQAYIEERLQEHLSVTACAKAVHLSPSYFSNLFKKETGMTLAQYIINRRMEKAKEMVLEGRQVQDIAISLGYEDRPYFTELFKKHTGRTPTEFRQLYAASSSKESCRA